ncbi:hypothetical protein SAMN04515671_2415 [Nakamurella panacisegetis]|uniref:Uridine kinase n=1 Tax=Nakamurella panacisegetis TaxID=1090615 RepID=A0A1H0NMD5_9ACTN|nr:hypothetical protein [Nakamurella panacisegetis]SDO93912.1 hypothetical protein SAMN04515671_2415 [Nakamurella panacisegetis]
MRFIPLTPARLVDELADWIGELHGRRIVTATAGTVVGFDGSAEVGTTELADRVAERMRGRGAVVVRATTNWWWRPAALRLELGREDVDMLLTGWVDDEALRRELFEPVAGGRPHITRLRDPGTDRSVRQTPARVPAGSVVILDGPFLLAADLPLDASVFAQVGPGALRRSLPDDRQWWLEADARYGAEYHPADRADVVLSYDHPSAPAARGLGQSARPA